jgi:non-ribosomal peptide synthetase component E (peptide arylation enzyme)
VKVSNEPTRERWRTRRIPPALERAYVEDGWWTQDTLGALLARQLAAHPEARIAIWSRSRPWQGSYAEIDDEARRLVTLLYEMGVQPGDTVAFQLPNWREAVVSFAALALGGFTVVPIVHIYGRKEVAFILEQSGAAAYISPSSRRPLRRRCACTSSSALTRSRRARAAPPGSPGPLAPIASPQATFPRCNRRTSRCSLTLPEPPATPRA